MTSFPESRGSRGMLGRYQMHAHLRIAIYFAFISTFKTKFCSFLYICKCLFYRFALTVTTSKRGIDRNKEAVLVFFNDNRKPSVVDNLLH